MTHACTMHRLFAAVGMIITIVHSKIENKYKLENLYQKQLQMNIARSGHAAASNITADHGTFFVYHYILNSSTWQCTKDRKRIYIYAQI